MSVADEIKAKLDIVSYIQQTVPLRKAGRTYKACCPFHSEKTPSFVVNPDTQSWRCYGACSTGGDIFNFAQKQHGWSFAEALNELGRLAGVEVQRRTPEQRARDQKLDEMRGLMAAVTDFFHLALLDNPAVLAYAASKRGFSEDTIARYGLGFAPNGWTHTVDHLQQLGYEEDLIITVGLARRSDQGRVYDYFRNRLMIPIRDERGRVIGFGARALNPEDEPKYLNSPQTPLFDKSRTLFGLDIARSTIRDSETAVIVEGYMDALQAHQAGFTNVVAQMGTSLTEMQLKLLAPRWAKRIILALDSDAAGQNATMRSLEVARTVLEADYSGRLSIDLRVLQIPGAKDPDDLIRESPQRWQSLVDSAQPVAEYVIDHETAHLTPDATVQEREAVARRLLPMLLASENNLYKKDNIQKLALRLRISENDLLMWAEEQRRAERARPPRRFDTPPEPPTIGHSQPGQPRPAKTFTHGSRASWEIESLHILFQQPDLFYQVNRKFRELAAANESLLDGPLCDFSVEDFSQTDCRALMQVFQEAVEQMDMEPVEYLRDRLDDALWQMLEDFQVLSDVSTRLPTELKHRMGADLAVVLKESKRTLDLKIKLVENALEMRRQRLDRERNDLSFLVREAQFDAAQEEKMHLTISRSLEAKHLIDSELKRQSKILY